MNRALGSMRDIMRSKTCVIEMPEERRGRKNGKKMYLNTYWPKFPKFGEE